jgi:DNA-binding GntR family transcriptional regulator
MQDITFARAPLFQQVRDALLERIKAGEWKPGLPLPNEGELAREYRVSSGTIRKSLDILEAQRVITRKQGRGTFVCDQTELSAMPQAVQEFLQAIGGATVSGCSVVVNGKPYSADGLRLVADGLLGIAAWLEQRPQTPTKAGRKVA